MNHYRREPGISEFTPTPAQTSRREIFTNGILKYPFQKVFEALGELEAIDWGERCLYDSDTHTSDGKTFPLSGFPFQTTYAEWKKQNLALVSETMEAIRDRDANRRLAIEKRYANAPKPIKKSTSKKRE